MFELNSLAWQKGFMAWWNNKERKDNPYKQIKKEMEWYAGWEFARRGLIKEQDACNK